MRVLLFCSGQSTLSHILEAIFKPHASYLKTYNYESEISNIQIKITNKSGKLPRKFEEKINEKYLTKIQNNYLKLINEEKPDLIFIYNDQMLTEETLNKIDPSIRVGIFLADSPLFLQKRKHILGLIRRADAVFAPDTYWIEQCKMLGVKKAQYLIPGYNAKHHYIINELKSSISSKKNDVFFMGSPYTDNWGYKRALFLSKFCKFDFKFIGPKHWQEWFNEFPELSLCWQNKAGYLSDEELNILMNNSKICPVDANPGIINGIHIRAFDCIASGALPLIEYRKDLDEIFNGTDIMFIKDYNSIPEITNYYLKNEKTRQETVNNLNMIINKKYTCQEASKIILKTLEIIK
jgi:spore maturation protein CgeB